MPANTPAPGALSDARAQVICDDPVREAQCIEYLACTVAVARQSARDILGDETDHEAEPQMLAALLAAEVVFLNTHWWKEDWPEEARKTAALCVGCSDVFAWACADAEGLLYGEIEDLYDHWRHDPLWGSAVWCAKKRRLMPQKRVEDRIRAAGLWDLDALAPAFETPGAEMPAMFAALHPQSIEPGDTDVSAN